MRYFIDTNVFIYSLIEKHRLKKNVLQFFEDYENQIYVSSESIKEFIHLFQQNRIKVNIKKPEDVFEYIESLYYQVYLNFSLVHTCLSPLPHFSPHPLPK